MCLLVQQSNSQGSPLVSHQSQKSLWAIRKEKAHLAKAQAERLKLQLSPAVQHAMELASEKGASSWLLALPLKEHGFNLSKSSFQDALCLRYGWQLHHTQTHCVCGQQFNQDHALSYSTGGLPSVRHNEIRNYLETRLSEVCSDSAIELTMQPLNGEEFTR